MVDIPCIWLSITRSWKLKEIKMVDLSCIWISKTWFWKYKNKQEQNHDGTPTLCVWLSACTNTTSWWGRRGEAGSRRGRIFCWARRERERRTRLFCPFTWARGNWISLVFFITLIIYWKFLIINSSIFYRIKECTHSWHHSKTVNIHSNMRWVE